MAAAAENAVSGCAPEMASATWQLQRRVLKDCGRRKERAGHCLRLSVEDFLAKAPRGEDDHIFADCECDARKHASQCRAPKEKFNSTDNSKRKVQQLLFWRVMLGPSFPIIDKLLMSSWKHIDSCEYGYKMANGHKKKDKLCVNPNHVWPSVAASEHVHGLLKCLFEALEELKVVNDDPVVRDLRLRWLLSQESKVGTLELMYSSDVTVLNLWTCLCEHIRRIAIVEVADVKTEQHDDEMPFEGADSQEDSEEEWPTDGSPHMGTVLEVEPGRRAGEGIASTDGAQQAMHPGSGSVNTATAAAAAVANLARPGAAPSSVYRLTQADAAAFSAGLFPPGAGALPTLASTASYAADNRSSAMLATTALSSSSSAGMPGQLSGPKSAPSGSHLSSLSSSAVRLDPPDVCAAGAALAASPDRPISAMSLSLAMANEEPLRLPALGARSLPHRPPATQSSDAPLRFDAGSLSASVGSLTPLLSPSLSSSAFAAAAAPTFPPSPLPSTSFVSSLPNFAMTASAAASAPDQPSRDPGVSESLGSLARAMSDSILSHLEQLRTTISAEDLVKTLDTLRLISGSSSTASSPQSLRSLDSAKPCEDATPSSSTTAQSSLHLSQPQIDRAEAAAEAAMSREFFSTYPLDGSSSTHGGPLPAAPSAALAARAQRGRSLSRSVREQKGGASAVGGAMAAAGYAGGVGSAGGSAMEQLGQAASTSVKARRTNSSRSPTSRGEAPSGSQGEYRRRRASSAQLQMEALPESAVARSTGPVDTPGRQSGKAGTTLWPLAPMPPFLPPAPGCGIMPAAANGSPEALSLFLHSIMNSYVKAQAPSRLLSDCSQSAVSSNCLGSVHNIGGSPTGRSLAASALQPSQAPRLDFVGNSHDAGAYLGQPHFQQPVQPPSADAGCSAAVLTRPSAAGRALGEGSTAAAPHGPRLDAARPSSSAPAYRRSRALSWPHCPLYDPQAVLEHNGARVDAAPGQVVQPEWGAASHGEQEYQQPQQALAPDRDSQPLYHLLGPTTLDNRGDGHGDTASSRGGSGGGGGAALVRSAPPAAGTYFDSSGGSNSNSNSSYGSNGMPMLGSEFAFHHPRGDLGVRSFGSGDARLRSDSGVFHEPQQAFHPAARALSHPPSAAADERERMASSISPCHSMAQGQQQQQQHASFTSTQSSDMDSIPQDLSSFLDEPESQWT